MIPKVIHYCWFGGAPLPEKERKCMESWKKFAPDYNIVRWDESNYDVHKNQYMSDAYDRKKWGFVPDYARFDIIYKYGGIYLDTDVELVKSLDELLSNDAYMGFEGGKWINGGIGFGAVAGNPLIKGLRDMYDDIKFVKDDGGLDTTPSPHYITAYLVEHGLIRDDSMQVLEGSLRIYPTEYFAAKDYDTNKINITENTISIHQYSATWNTPKEKLVKTVKRLVGVKAFNHIIDIKHKVIR
ncbi:glycosyltransferase family 32 protein [Bifidobacterium vespertilionis]|uniref:glycosyltransferase family 32 protein n=1 Tax=Bifidobacterium vespertilionis TaxID=2562524 RepID=UPI001BDD2964|nr:glycosyltransferase [Bifidobacterium vespertilionis]MBT1179929.1 glycosyl transferase [Bifidobacterium vespertilionis]